MKKLYISLLAILIVSCIKHSEEPAASFHEKKVFILNGASETLSVLHSGKLANDVLETGETPNYIAGDNHNLYIINSGFGGTPSIQVIDPEEVTTKSTILLPAGSNPFAATYAIDRLYVTSFTHDSVYIINTETNMLEGGFKTGKAPEGILFYNYLFVVATGYDIGSYTFGPGALLVYDINTLDLVDSISLPVNPQWAIVVGNKIHVLVSGSYGSDDGAVYVVDPDSLTIVDSLHIGGYPGFIANYGADKVYVSYYSGKLLSYDPNTLSIMSEMDVPTGAMGISIDLEGLLYLAISSWTDMNYVYEINTVNDSITNIYETGTQKGTQFTLAWEPMF